MLSDQDFVEKLLIITNYFVPEIDATFNKGFSTSLKMTYQKSIWNETPSMKSYTLSNFRQLPQIQQLSEEKQFEMEVVGNVLPFKANNYVVEQLIDWNNIPKDPIFVLTFLKKEC